MTRTSRIPGFYRQTLAERRNTLAAWLGCAIDDLDTALDGGGMDVARADETMENVVGTYALPLALGLNFTINDRDVLVPMVVEEPSVVAAASNAARLVRAGGGFRANADAPRMIAQIQLWDVPDAAAAEQRVLAARDELFAAANRSVPTIVEHGGGAKDVVVRNLGDGLVVAHLIVDVCDAMGANTVNTMAEAVAPAIEALAGGTRGLRILSNLADRRLVRVSARVPVDALATNSAAGNVARDAIVRASHFAERDPYRAATHNKGIMNGVDAVALATGNDWRAIEAGAHAFAARSGTYSPLATWRIGDDGALEGQLEMPLALGTVGGTLRVHPAAQFALRVIGADGSQHLAMIAASVGLASNLAALRALATEGIQRGHMQLHARSIAVAAGAHDGEIAPVADAIVAERDVSVEAAERALAAVRSRMARE